MYLLRHHPFPLLLALLLGSAVAAFAADAPDAGLTATPQAEALDRLEAAADLVGEVPIIVQLRTDSLPAIEPLTDQSGDVPLAQRKLGDRARLITKAQNRLATAIPGHTGRVTRYRYLPLAALHANRDTLRRLRTLPEVLSVTPDRPHAPLLNGSVPSIGGNLAYAAGLTGAGWAVAVIDTGVQTSHPNFAGRVLTNAEACFSGSGIGSGSGVATGSGIATITSLCPNLLPCPGTRYPDNTACGPGAGFYCTGHSSCWHGTHVAGIAVGNHSTYRGVAPGANLIPIQVFVIEDGRLVAYDSDIIAGLEHVLTLSQTGTNVAAVNMSLGGDVYTSTRQCDLNAAPTKTAIDALRAAGVATVIAAGNNSYKTGIGNPGCISSAVSVGATDDGTGIASFSNLATALSVFAPGVSIYSSVPTNSIGGANGTSMATPHVAGTFAVLRQKATESMMTPSVDNLLAALRQSGTAITY
ncbi:MAG TPA: S8 family serine peptidase, partial [Lamprocystis sp. (in: g-proteobacteria)]|nr:S8 family serine peptidase [Lamprocystis sp. (in: g-proteobacteria)]